MVGSRNCSEQKCSQVTKVKSHFLRFVQKCFMKISKKRATYIELEVHTPSLAAKYSLHVPSLSTARRLKKNFRFFLEAYEHELQSSENNLPLQHIY